MFYPRICNIATTETNKQTRSNVLSEGAKVMWMTEEEKNNNNGVVYKVSAERIKNKNKKGVMYYLKES